MSYYVLMFLLTIYALTPMAIQVNCRWFEVNSCISNHIDQIHMYGLTHLCPNFRAWIVTMPLENTANYQTVIKQNLVLCYGNSKYILVHIHIKRSQSLIRSFDWLRREMQWNINPIAVISKLSIKLWQTYWLLENYILLVSKVVTTWELCIPFSINLMLTLFNRHWCNVPDVVFCLTSLSF